MYTFDIFVQNYFSLTRTPVLTDIVYIITSLFDASIHFILIVLCITGLIYLVRNLRYALLFFTVLFFGAVIVYTLKNIFDVARPLDGFVSVFGSSFPSYHATSATIFFVMLMHVFDSHFKSFGRIVCNIFCVTSILLVAFSRVYLGVHWLSDVLFGIILGVLISYIAVVIFKFIINSWDRRLKAR